MSISQMLLPEFEAEMENTRKLLERVPDGRFDYQPHPKSMALGRLASHVAELPSWTRMTIETEVLQLDPGMKAAVAQSRQEVLATFEKSVAEARAAIAGASDEHLQKTWTLKVGEQTVFSLPRAAVIRSMVMNHLIHHRAQLGVYLRLNEIEIPGMYGPSADEMKFWTSEAPS